MILSMTGFGRGIASSATKKITVDIKSLNSKQLDLSMRVPGCFKEIELETRSRIAPVIERGKVEFNAVMEQVGEDTPVRINTAVLAGYKLQLDQLAKTLDVPAPHDWFSVLLRMPDALKSDNSSLSEEDMAAFVKAVDEALAALMDFRRSEGEKLYKFFISKIDNITELLDSIEVYEAERVPKIKAKLEDQLSRLTSIEYDRGRLEQELIFYLEKLDVTEEKTRLRAHLNYFLETMGAASGELPNQGQGKKLGFIAQEMGREINTLGSKSNQAEMQKIVVRMKDELEQIKEQVLNVL
ncbi:MAG: YicC family protein [Bacteroidales bacterium]|nr:YicC family protein [Bacteroidales bacterium]MBD5222659.1 YicC family protein [Bacteroidales bacterium]MBD5302030.1 YicC family protein [Bacteroides sp.]